MDALPSARRALALVIAGAILLASGALFLTPTEGEAVSPVFHVLNIQVVAALVMWSLLAWSARRLIVGKLPKRPFNSLAAFIWGGSRVALLLATVIVMVGWLIALALGLEIEAAFGRAVVLLVVVTAFTGIIGGAILNSMLVAKHGRVHRTE